MLASVQVVAPPELADGCGARSGVRERWAARKARCVAFVRRNTKLVSIGGLVVVLAIGATIASLEVSTSVLGQQVGAAPTGRAAGIGGTPLAQVAPPAVSLPPATAAPAPAPPALAASAPLQTHEIFGYAPYWTLPSSGGFDVANLTTLAYFSLGVNGDGTLQQSGGGWNGYQSQDLANLVTRAHAANARVVLTVTCFDQTALNQITSSPTAAATLSAALIVAVSAKNLDGVNFDFEGQGSGDRQGLTALITQVSSALHGANPHWQVTMATYASAAGDPGGFYDIAALAPAVDGFFVGAYDMNNKTTPSPTAPLVGGNFSDTQALQEFTKVVPASKVILGVPYYGYDWPTTTGASGATATGAETPLSYAVVAASGHPVYWDPATQTAWTSYQVGNQWHQTYFDDPQSLALKAQLANSFNIAGLGIWALGMDGNDPAMLAALLGQAPAVKDLTTGPTATTPTTVPPTSTSTSTSIPASSPSPSSSSSSSPTTPTTTASSPPTTVATGSTSTTTTQPVAGPTYTTTGVWNALNETLAPIASLPTGGGATLIQPLTSLATNDPTLSCLVAAGAPALQVWSYPAQGVDVVVASKAFTPPDCAAAIWMFVPSAGTPVTGGAGSGSTTTTTSAPSTTSTTAVRSVAVPGPSGGSASSGG
jgi:hypothetical protein